ncbi:MAG: 30S ribosomal protein S27ae [Candidatus Bathyarchaeota archaeon]
MPKKEVKEKKVKKKRMGIGSYYKIEGENVKRLRPNCERCGPGYFERVGKCLTLKFSSKIFQQRISGKLER